MFAANSRKWEDCLSYEKECEARLWTLEVVSNQAGELTPDERDSYLSLGGLAFIPSSFAD